MKRVLVIAPSSYPVNGAEGIVNIKLLEAMTKSGEFQIDLISKKNKWIHYPSGSIESYGVKCTLNIIEVDNNPFNPVVVWENFMSYIKFGLVFKGCHWAYPALKIAERLVKSTTYDYVLTKNEPSFLIGYYLQNKYGIKWVASWNDPYPRDNYPSPYGKGPDFRSFVVEKKIDIMRNASVHIFPSLRLMNYMDKYLRLPNDCTKIVVPHIITPEPVSEIQQTDTLRFLHAGDLKNPRSPRVLLQGIEKAMKQNPSMKLSFTIMGVMSKTDIDYVKDLGLESIVNFLPPCEYKDSLKIAKDFDISLIIEAKCKEGIFLPTKVGDCMQSNLIMFAISPQIGNMKDLYDNEFIQYFADNTSSDNVANVIHLIYKDFQNGKLDRKPKYKREYLADYVIAQYLKI